MANEIKIKITEKGTAKKYSRAVKGAARATDKFKTSTKKATAATARLRLETTGLTRSVGAFRNKLLLVSFATGVVVASLGKLASVAGDAQETLSKFDAVFKEQGAAAKVFANELAVATNRSRIELIDFLSTLQDTFVPLGFTREAASGLSQDLVKLAIDVASFNNKVNADVIRDFQSALVGNTETVRKYGIVITQATLGQELVNAGLADSVKNATEAQKAFARFNIILRSTTDAHGDAERTITSFNNVMVGASSAASDLAIVIGNRLLPVTTNLATAFTLAARGATELFDTDTQAVIDKYTELARVLTIIDPGGVRLIGVLKLLAEAQVELARSTEITTKEIMAMALSMLESQEAADAYARSWERQIELWVIAAKSAKKFEQQLPDLSDAMRETEFAMVSINLRIGKMKRETDDAAQAFRNMANDISNAISVLERLTDKDTSDVNKFFTLAGAIFGFSVGGPSGALLGANIGGQVAGLAGLEHGGFTSGQTSIVGERGPELIKPPAGSQIFTNAQSKQMAGPQTIILEINGEAVGTAIIPAIERGSELGANRIALT